MTMLGKCILVIAVLCAFADDGVEGKRLLLRPIPAAKVHQFLKAASIGDAVPEGRIISHGFAALNGFVLGLKKGIIGVALADRLATLGSRITTNSTSNSTPSGKISYNGTTHELCFSGRSASSDILASGDAEDDENDEDDDIAQERAPTVTGYATSTGMTSDMTSPSASNDATNIRYGSVSASATTTQTTGGAVHCIVLQKG